MDEPVAGVAGVSATGPKVNVLQLGLTVQVIVQVPVYALSFEKMAPEVEISTELPVMKVLAVVVAVAVAPLRVILPAAIVTGAVDKATLIVPLAERTGVVVIG